MARQKERIIYAKASPDAYLILKHLGAVLLGGWCVEEGGTYFKVF